MTSTGGRRPRPAGGAPTGGAPGDDEPAAALEYRDGGGRTCRRLLDSREGPVVVGRSERCDLVIDWDPQVSREHARLQPVGGNWVLVDDGLSRNGTYVDGVRLRGERRLRHRDRVRIGRTVLTYLGVDEALAVRTVTPGRPAVSGLTDKQRETLDALCRPLLTEDGHVTPATNSAIAATLGISTDAVKDRLAGLFSKFGLEDLPQNEKRLTLARHAIDDRLV